MLKLGYEHYHEHLILLLFSYKKYTKIKEFRTWEKVLFGVQKNSPKNKAILTGSGGRTLSYRTVDLLRYPAPSKKVQDISKAFQPLSQRKTIKPQCCSIKVKLFFAPHIGQRPESNN